MATASRAITTFNTDFGDIVVTLQYDDVLLRATGVTCVNPSPSNVLVTVTRNTDGRQYEKVFGPGTTQLAIPTGAAARIDLTFNSRGGLDGYDAACTWPA